MLRTLSEGFLEPLLRTRAWLTSTGRNLCRRVVSDGQFYRNLDGYTYATACPL